MRGEVCRKLESSRDLIRGWLLRDPSFVGLEQTSTDSLGLCADVSLKQVLGRSIGLL